MERLSYEALSRINSVLLVVSAIGLAAAATAVGHLLLERGRLREIEAGLLARQALQEELMRGADPAHVLFPHVARDLSFVLNPAMKRTTWKAGGTEYPVNGLGLRGPEIAPKPEATTRIALVGDSVVFGWKLGDADRLSASMQARLDEDFGPGRYEVVTVALPGWNVVDQDAFLRRHLSRIAPDHVIWSLMRNDVFDSPGPAPPGIPMLWNAPQKTSEQPFQVTKAASHLKDVPAPGLRERWRDNLRRIAAFQRDFAVPVSLLWWQARHRALFDLSLAESGVELPLWTVPAEYRYEDPSWCVAAPDCHPSLRANQRVAIGLLGALVDRGVVAPIAFDPAEREFLDAFAAERRRPRGPEEQKRFFGALADRLPGSFSLELAQEAVLFGLDGRRMRLDGLLLLRGRSDERSLRMEIGSLARRPGRSQEIRLRVRNERGEARETRVALRGPRTPVRVELPEAAGFGLYEIEWSFAHSECEAPGLCHSATLQSAALR